MPNSGRYLPGDVIAGKYELLRVISHGGMGSVWMAHHLALQSETAIKLIRSDLRTETLTERFINEARVAARVDHPGVINIFDLGVTERGDPFLAMELLKGEDLREMLRRASRLAPVHAVQLLLPVADALATAHARGIVHRDLKPENVFIAALEQRIQPKIVDFGIAKPGWPCERRLTRAGTVMGSPEYMSPEQAQGREDVDQRVDVWSFCVVLYECLVGRPPWSGNYESTLNDILEKPIVPITELGVPLPALWAILDRGLAKHREQRWQDMRSLGRALAEWLLEQGVEDDVCAHSLRATWLKDSSQNLAEQPATPAGAARASATWSGAPPSAEAATVQLTATTPASWGVGYVASCVGPSAPVHTKRLVQPVRVASARVLALALTIFGVGCAGGSAWLGSALVLPTPPLISAKVLTFAGAPSQKVLASLDQRAREKLRTGPLTKPAAPRPASVPRPRSQGEQARTASPRRSRSATTMSQGTRRARLPAELEFGF